MPRPPPSAVTSVWRTSTAELKNSIYNLPGMEEHVQTTLPFSGTPFKFNFRSGRFVVGVLYIWKNRQFALTVFERYNAERFSIPEVRIMALFVRPEKFRFRNLSDKSAKIFPNRNIRQSIESCEVLSVFAQQKSHIKRQRQNLFWHSDIVVAQLDCLCHMIFLRVA